DIDPASGVLHVTFQDDRSGLDPQSLANLWRYSVSGISARAAGSVAITGATAAAPSADPTAPQSVTIAVGDPRRLRSGRLFVTVDVNGLADRAGNPVVGVTSGPGSKVVIPLTGSPVLKPLARRPIPHRARHR